MKQADDRNLITSLSMVLPFGPAEKQALLEAADTTARAKLLIAFLEMARLRPAAGCHAAAGRTDARQVGHDYKVGMSDEPRRAARGVDPEAAGNPGLPGLRTARWNTTPRPAS